MKELDWALGVGEACRLGRPPHLLRCTSGGQGECGGVRCVTSGREEAFHTRY